MEGLEERRRSPHAEVVARKSEVGEVGFVDMVKKALATFILEPELEEGAAVAEDEAADRGVCLRSCGVVINQ